MMNTKQVVAAHVLTRVRFSKVWQELTILIPSTELNMEYWGQGIARIAQQERRISWVSMVVLKF